MGTIRSPKKKKLGCVLFLTSSRTHGTSKLLQKFGDLAVIDEPLFRLALKKGLSKKLALTLALNDRQSWHPESVPLFTISNEALWIFPGELQDAIGYALRYLGIFCTEVDEFFEENFVDHEQLIGRYTERLKKLVPKS